MISYDPILFYSYLETLLSANNQSVNPSKVVFQSNINSESPWLLMDAANEVFKYAKQRVYKTETGFKGFPGIPNNIRPILEEPPKWKALNVLLGEIKDEMRMKTENGEDVGPVLIMLNGERSCEQIRQLFSNYDFFVQSEVEENIQKTQNFYKEESKTMLDNLFIKYFAWKKGMLNILTIQARQTEEIAEPAKPIVNKRRRVLGKTLTSDKSKDEPVENFDILNHESEEL